jgi:hypothetical protein
MADARFERLSDFVHIYHASQEKAAVQATNEPALIVLCSWMSAAPKHVKKYIDNYQRLYHHTDILWIEAHLKGMWLGSDLKPAADFVTSYLKATEHSTKGRIILHMFSNGGARNATALASLLYERHQSLPFDALVLDSCPSRGEVAAATKAMTFALPNKYFLRQISWYAIWVPIALYVFIVSTFGLEDIISWIRRLLVDTDVFQKDIPRLYLYSHGDELVRSTDVHDHAEESRRAGYTDVREEVFQKAGHCALLNEDSDRYWKAFEAVVMGK